MCQTKRSPSVWDVDAVTPHSFDVALEINHPAAVIRESPGDLVIGDLDWREVWYPETAGLRAHSLSLPLAEGN